MSQAEAAPTVAVGKFVWYDLMSLDLEASKAFYNAVFGWTTKEVDMGPLGTYNMLHAGEKGVGGIVPFENNDGIPSHWIAYVTVNDVDEASKEIAALGGQVCVPATDIPQTGRFSVVNDPTGAAFSPFTYAFPPETDEAVDPNVPPTPGTFCWNELMTPDVEAAKAFYGKLFGWSVADQDMGDFVYHLFQVDGVNQGGMMATQEGSGQHPYWLPYIAVANCGDSAETITANGGKLFVEPTPVPGMGRFSVAQDPSGGVFGILGA